MNWSGILYCPIDSEINRSKLKLVLLDFGPPQKSFITSGPDLFDSNNKGADLGR